MSGKREAEVLVVGAGPVGLFTALSLVDQGVNVTILDKHRRTHSHSYALALHPETLRLLDDLGLAPELIRKGHRIEELSFYEGGEQRAGVSLSKLQGGFPFVVVVPQSSLEWALEGWLRDRGTSVLWNHEVTDLRSEGDRATVDVSRYDKQSLGYPIATTEWVVAEQFRIDASHVVGADGYHSTVRRQMGIEYAALGDAQLFSVMEFSTGTRLGDEARIVIDDRSTNVLWPLADGRYRWTFQIDDSTQHSPTIARLSELARERAPWFEAESPILVWSSPVRFERRMAECFARSNVWLAGDAAHLTGPVGVQSMNVGLREAHDVAGRINAVLRGAEAQESADGYNASRREEWARLLGRGGDLTSSQDAGAWVSRHRHEILSCLPGSGPDLEQMLGQVGLTPSWKP